MPDPSSDCKSNAFSKTFRLKSGFCHFAHEKRKRECNVIDYVYLKVSQMNVCK